MLSVVAVAESGGGRETLSRLDALLREAATLARPTHETLYVIHDLRAKLCAHLGESPFPVSSLVGPRRTQHHS